MEYEGNLAARSMIPLIARVNLADLEELECKYEPSCISISQYSLSKNNHSHQNGQIIFSETLSAEYMPE